MADIPRKNSCRVCLSLGTCIHHPAAHTKPLVYSSVGQVVGKQKHKMNDEVHQMGVIPKHVDGSSREGYKNQGTQGAKQDISEPEQCFLGSSVRYAGPDEYLGCVKERKEPINMNKTGVKRLEETEDASSLEYATRGDWWKGSLYY
ncbi:uncharacterized protein LOC131061149 isoform X2 [Cryptomeria japonica]|uniref:uncharacterized protein LOC131061149 isoform X2 n=1 Tax=Cryptomeria japonica TaxID=3369 RepID=UPI0027DA238B|nr:uncharacterized protein LOC131061149 isoform X2 [Cryptomeria japonica]